MSDAHNILVLSAADSLPDALSQTVAEAVEAAGAVASAPNRLAKECVEMAFRGDAVSVCAAARAAVGGAEIDANVVSAENRRKRLLICDMDSTIIPVECIDEIADFAGVKDRVSEITERAMRGELDFDAALRERVGLLTGLPVEALERTYKERITLNPGAAEMVAAMKAASALTALVSGGFTYFTEKVAADAGFERHQANTLLVADGKLTGAPGDPILGRAAKLSALKAMTAEIGATPADAVAVGDGANDLDMIRAAGLGVAYRAKPAVAAEADAKLDYSDLRAVLWLQGLTT